MGRKRIWQEPYLDEILDHMPNGIQCESNIMARSLRFALYRRARRREIKILSSIFRNVVRTSTLPTAAELDNVD